MRLQFEVFADPLYSADNSATFDPSDVVTMEEKQVALFLRGQVWVTYILLRNGERYLLKGRVSREIAAARRQSQVAAPQEESAD